MSATARLKLSTLDTKALAKDYDTAHLEDAILSAASGSDENPDSLESRYLILNDLLKNREYDTVETDCSMELKNTGTDTEEWEIVRTYDLENNLVGGLMTYLSDSDLLTTGGNTDRLFKHPENHGSESDEQLSGHRKPSQYFR